MELTKKQKIMRYGYLFPFGIFAYFLVGAIGGNISLMPIKGNNGLDIIGGAAWIATLSPLFWLIAEVVRHDPIFGEETKKRNLIAFLLYSLAVASFFYSAIYTD